VLKLRHAAKVSDTAEAILAVKESTDIEEHPEKSQSRIPDYSEIDRLERELGVGEWDPLVVEDRLRREHQERERERQEREQRMIRHNFSPTRLDPEFCCLCGRTCEFHMGWYR
jgi:hypothetical protein